MTAEVLICGPSETRIEAYRLLAERAPKQVLVDEDMPPGVWVIVRGLNAEEEARRRLARSIAEAHQVRTAMEGAPL
jgi:hypothetical protein